MFCGIRTRTRFFLKKDCIVNQIRLEIMVVFKCSIEQF